MTCPSVRNRSRLVCAAGTLLGLTFFVGVNASQVQARPSSTQAAVSVTSVSAPVNFNSGDNISLQVGLSGGSAQVHVTSLPAGVVDYTATVSDGTPFSVPTSASIPGASEGDTVNVTLKVTVGQQTLETTSEATATRGDLEPIFPKASTEEGEDGDLEPIFPKASAMSTKEGEDGDLEPIFPKASAEEGKDGDLEPIFPKASAMSAAGDLEPIFPKASTASAGDLEPISPKASAMFTRSILEPIFPRFTASLFGDLEPIFPRASMMATAGDLEPIFPRASPMATAGDLEPIFPRATTPGDLEPIFPKP